MLTWVYLSPLNLISHFKNASRTVLQMNTCYQKVCQEIKEPLYVSTQSNFHPFHNGPEHRYLLKKNGCNVINIEENTELSDKMMVVVDGGNFDIKKTKYYELDLFGPSNLYKTYPCQHNLNLILLKKNK